MVKQKVKQISGYLINQLINVHKKQECNGNQLTYQMLNEILKLNPKLIDWYLAKCSVVKKN